MVRTLFFCLMSSSAVKRLGFALLLIAALAAVWLYSRRSTPPSAPVADAPAAKTSAAAKDSAPPPPAAPPLDANAAADFRAATDAALRRAQPRERARELGLLMEQWIARDLEGALAYVRQMPRGTSDYAQCLLMVLDAVSRRDADRALNLARELATTRDERSIYSVVFDRLARENPTAAAQRLALVPPGEARQNALRALTGAWMRADQGAALGWAQALAEPGDRAVAIETALQELAAKDPLQAVELAQKNLTGAALARSVLAALQSLNATDPLGASGLVPLLPVGEMQVLAAAEVGRALAARNVDTALAWWRSLPPGQTQTVALHNILTTWAATDLVAARGYVDNLPAGDVQTAAAEHLARLVGAREPSNTLAWAQGLRSEPARKAALASVASAWAQRDPAGASRWAAAQPEGTLPATALEATLSYWVLQDVPGVKEFIRTLPGPAQTSAAAATAPLLAQNDPEGALAWAQLLPDASAREAALAAAFTRWNGNAPAAARTWLERADLPAATKERLQPKP